MGSKIDSNLKAIDDARCLSRWNEIPEIYNKFNASKSTPEKLAFAKVALVESQLYLELKDQDVNLLAPHGELSQSTLQSFQGQLANLTFENAEYKLLRNVAMAHVFVLGGKYDAAIELLQQPDSYLRSDITLNYSYVALIKRAALLGTSFEANNDLVTALEVYRSSDTLINQSVIAQSPEGLLWAELMAYRFAILATSTSWEDQSVSLSALRNYHQVTKLLAKSPQNKISKSQQQRRLNLLNIHLMYSSKLLQQSPEDLTVHSEVRELSNSMEKILLDNAPFPHASSSNVAIEQFADSLASNWSSLTVLDPITGLVKDPESVPYTRKVCETLKKCVTKTFHSCSIARHLITVLAALGQYDEAMALFKVYLAYQEKARLRQEAGESVNSGDNDSSVIEAFSKAIIILVHIKKDGIYAKQLADKLTLWLNPHPAESATLRFNGNGDSIKRNSAATTAIEEATTFSSLPYLSVESPVTTGLRVGDTIDPVSVSLGTAWSSIARANALYAEMVTDSSIRAQAVDKAIQAYAKSIDFDAQDPQSHFEYAMILAKNGKINMALEICRKGLLHNQYHLPTWHLLALLLSTREEHDTAIKVINSALDTALTKQSDKPRTIIQMKMTQVALIEASHGIVRALDKVPEVFAVFYDLFPFERNSDKNLQGPRSKQSKGLKLAKSISRKSISSVRGILGAVGDISSLNDREVESQNREKSTNEQPKAHATFENDEKQKTKQPSEPKAIRSNQENDIFRFIWLWTAAIYKRAELLSEAEEAIVEAESISGPTADTHIELGLLIKEKRPIHALEEFESALEKSPNHLRAILAFSLLILDHAQQPRTLDDDNKLHENVSSSLPDSRNGHADSNGGVIWNEKIEYNGTVNGTGLNGNGAEKVNGTRNDEIETASSELNGLESHPAIDPLFISVKDKLAALARVQGLLESVTEKGTGYNSSEAWWLLSRAYEENGNHENSQEALWKCVALEESRAVRDYNWVLW